MPEQGIVTRKPEIARYMAAIMDAYPQFAGVDIRMVSEAGQYNDAFVLADQFIFRFPRYPEGIEMMRHEVSFLKAISGRTTLPVPEPVFCKLEADEPGEVFMGYRLLPGQALWRPAIFAQKNEEVLDRWAWQLAGFLKELHTLPVADFMRSWPAAERIEDWADMYAEVQEHLFAFMRADARREIADHFENYLGDASLHTFQKSPRHGDFGSGNILYDPGTKRITAIIDFGYAAVGDPAMDIAAASTLGDALFGRFAHRYPGIERMLPRVRFYRGTYALFEALHGYNSGDRQAFEAGMKQYV